MHHVKEVDVLSANIDLLMKRLDGRANEKNEVMHIHDSHMTCEECGDTGHSGNNYPTFQEDVSYLNNNNYYNRPHQNQGWNEATPNYFGNYLGNYQGVSAIIGFLLNNLGGSQRECRSRISRPPQPQHMSLVI